MESSLVVGWEERNGVSVIRHLYSLFYTDGQYEDRDPSENKQNFTVDILCEGMFFVPNDIRNILFEIRCSSPNKLSPPPLESYSPIMVVDVVPMLYHEQGRGGVSQILAFLPVGLFCSPVSGLEKRTLGS